MNIYKKILLTIAFISLIFASCTQQKETHNSSQTVSSESTAGVKDDKTDITSTTSVISANTESDSVDKQFEKYNNLVNNYMDTFSSEFTQQAIDGKDYFLIESSTINNTLTDGGAVFRYKDKAGNVVRYKELSYGETGQSETNYYILDSNVIYINFLLSEYSCKIVSKYSGDVINYSVTNYIIDNGKPCVIDFDDKKIKEMPNDIGFFQISSFEEAFNNSYKTVTTK